MGNFETYDLVVVPFPFTDRATQKRRPALILSHPGYQEGCGHLICAMVTTAAKSNWSSDIKLKESLAAGLPKASTVRLKIFTLDARFVLRRLGRLAEVDRVAVAAALGSTFEG